IVEAQVLAAAGVGDALSRLQIDGQCRVTTPFHQAACRLRELLRGSAAHGTCGVGVGETVRHALEYPQQVLRYADLLHASVALDKLHALRQTLLAELEPLCSPAHAEELRVLKSENIAAEWLNTARAVARQCPPSSLDAIHSRLTQAGTVLFEGAQGVLLDEWRGFHPHTTWSTISTAAVEQALARFGITPHVEHYGVLRSYLTRHGAGPLPTEDPALDGPLHEPHNTAQGWQGRFRRGHPDAVLLRYALESVGNLTGLLISHLDVFERGASLKWCHAYQTEHGLLNQLPSSAGPDLSHQQVLTDLLLKVAPVFDREPILNASTWIEKLAEVTSVPVKMTSHGNTHRDVVER
ncbi:MAG: adenylosuccinate synthetase, partial [Verrucomicrobia bacterium]|nr:adenylosuccinate synthetase [Verrucomicrobiota bacterium]